MIVESAATYLPVGLDKFQADSQLICDVFIHLNRNNKIIRLRRAGAAFTQQEIYNFAEKGHKQLLIQDPLLFPESVQWPDPFAIDKVNPEIPFENQPVKIRQAMLEAQRSIRLKAEQESLGERAKILARIEEAEVKTRLKNTTDHQLDGGFLVGGRTDDDFGEMGRFRTAKDFQAEHTRIKKRTNAELDVIRLWDKQKENSGAKKVGASKAEQAGMFALLFTSCLGYRDEKFLEQVAMAMHLAIMKEKEVSSRSPLFVQNLLFNQHLHYSPEVSIREAKLCIDLAIAYTANRKVITGSFFVQQKALDRSLKQLRNNPNFYDRLALEMLRKLAPKQNKDTRAELRAIVRRAIFKANNLRV